MKSTERELLNGLATLNHNQKIKIKVYEGILKENGLLEIAKKMYIDSYPLFKVLFH